MNISCRGLIEGERKRLCKTDEATINRVFAKGGRELVERRQLMRGIDHSFELLPPAYGIHAQYYPEHAGYHLLKYIATCAAKSLFPDNFVDYQEMRFCRDGDDAVVLTYSDFVPDGNRAIKRRKRAMERFYAEPDKSKKHRIVTEATRLEESLNPGLTDTVANVMAGGISVPHPSANYHLVDGVTVFFEVESIHLPAALNLAHERGDMGTMRLLSMITAIYLRLLSDEDLAMLAKGGMIPPFAHRTIRPISSRAALSLRWA